MSLLRQASVAAIAIALVVVAGAASGRSPWHAARSSAAVPAPAVGALAALAGASLAAAVLVLWAVTARAGSSRRRRRSAPADPRELPRSLSDAAKAALLLLAALFVVVAGLWPLLAAQPQSPAGAVSPEQVGSATGPPPGHPRVGRSTSAVWLLAGAGGVLLLLGPIAFAVRRRRALTDAATVLQEPNERVGAAVVVSLADLEAIADPRAAIESAYLRMEQSLGAVAVERGRDETPSEFLGRLRRVLTRAGTAASTLTELFEVARFSAHDVGEPERRRAIEALRAIEDGLGERR